MKLEIGSWAKISAIPYSEVINMNIAEWIVPWFKSLNFFNRLLFFANIISIVTLMVMYLRKEFFLLKIQLIILLNLIFWFLNAPDPRFAYGFLFLGFSLNLAFLIKLWESRGSPGVIKFSGIVLACLLIIVVGRRIKAPVSTLTNAELWILPESFGKVVTTVHNSDFIYRVPDSNDRCFNSEIPCVPYPLSNIVLRGKDLQDGFKFVKLNP
jgi:hypothetical protein